MYLRKKKKCRKVQNKVCSVILISYNRTIGFDLAYFYVNFNILLSGINL